MLNLKLIYFAFTIKLIQTAPYCGGTINWKVVNSNASSDTVEVIIYQKHTWPLMYLGCNQSIIANLGWYTDGGGSFTGEPFIQCQPTVGNCSGSGFSTISERTYCTDFSSLFSISSGGLISRINLTRNATINVGFTVSSWLNKIRTSNNISANNSALVTRIDLTQKNPINTPPTVGFLPIVLLEENNQSVISILAADWDWNDTIRCRWAVTQGIAGNECGDVCSNLPSAILHPNNCTVIWTAVRRPYDISAGYNSSTYVAAIMVEDYVNATSISPMSSIPIQFLVMTYKPVSRPCNLRPTIVGDYVSQSCLGVSINSTTTIRIVASIGCIGDSIVEFITSSPMYMIKTNISQINGIPNVWYTTFIWRPTVDQIGPEVFCAAPVNQNGLVGDQYCLYFAVGYDPPVFIQGSASPLGTVLATHSVFSIQSNSDVRRPKQNGRMISIFNTLNPFVPVWEIDCGYSPNCIYTGNTLTFLVSNATWSYGNRYYITFAYGAILRDVFCGPESAAVFDPQFWEFNISNPNLSSTTSITTPPTTGTITTRPAIVTSATVTTSITTLPTTGTVTTSVVTVTSATVTPTTIRISETTTEDIRSQLNDLRVHIIVVEIIAGLSVIISIILLSCYLYRTRFQRQTETTNSSDVGPVEIHRNL